MLAPEAIAAGFGTKLATSTVVASSQPLPTQLVGTAVKVNGVLAPLLFVSPNQINYLIPAGTAAGNAQVVVASGDGSVSTGTVQIKSASPTIFTANASGSGIPAATLLRVAESGAQTPESIGQFDPGTGIFRPRPINLCPSGDRVCLILFLTGVRHAAADTVRVLIGGQSVVPAYFGPAPRFVGLDQINAEIPRSLIGSGLIKLSVAVSGSALSNEVEVEIGDPCGSSLPQVASLRKNPFARWPGVDDQRHELRSYRGGELCPNHR